MLYLFTYINCLECPAASCGFQPPCVCSCPAEPPIQLRTLALAGTLGRQRNKQLVRLVRLHVRGGLLETLGVTRRARLDKRLRGLVRFVQFKGAKIHCPVVDQANRIRAPVLGYKLKLFVQ